jgi:hypothetical protein
MSEPNDTSHASLLAHVAEKLELEPSDPATEEQLGQVASLAGAPLPPLFEAFQLKFGTCEDADLAFGGDSVVLSSAEEIIETMEAYGLEGEGVVPFADDFFGSLWLLMLREKGGDQPAEKVVLLPSQERYQNPGDPLETRAGSFAEFLEGLEADTE